MKKIPTLFKRDFEHDHGRYVTPELTEGCEWVLAGEGVATRKYDGTCVMLDEDGGWWARREVKAGREDPPHFWAIETDETTGKTVGWEPVGQSGFYQFFKEARARYNLWGSGTYELIGPKINGNPEHEIEHRLIKHDMALPLYLPKPLDYNVLRLAMLLFGRYGYEGVVWHHPDGRMAKLKVRDFRTEDES